MAIFHCRHKEQKIKNHTRNIKLADSHPKQGAFWGLMIGFVVGMVRMGLDFYYTEPPCGEEDLRPNIIRKVC